MRRTSLWLTLPTLLTGAALYAQTRPPRATPTPPAVKPVVLPTPSPTEPLDPKDNKDPDYYPWGELMTRVSKPEGILWTLTGNAQLAHQDSKFLSDTVLFNQDTKIASAPTKLRMEDPQNTITGDSGIAYYKKELRYADILGDVTIVARPKPEDPKATLKSIRKEFKSPVTITCDKVRYWWKQKRAFTDANVKITFTHKGKDWTITAATLEYFGSDEHVVLNGSVIALNNKGEKVLCDTADIVLKEGAETVTLKPVLKGTVIKADPEDEDEKDGKTTPPPPPLKKEEEKKTGGGAGVPDV